ncbi:MAG: signal peptidase II, partial [Myxococcota bacterium]
GFDFFSKQLVVDNLELGEKIPVVPDWFSITHAQNPGIAFSLDVPHAVIYAVGVVMLGMLAHTLWTIDRRARVIAAALAMLTAGGLGNIIDRIPDGTVTDFAFFYTNHPTLTPWLKANVGMTAWPVFNIADVLLIAGVIVFGIHQAIWGDDEEDEAAAPA